MSITTYDELKTAVARWLKRDDLTAYIPDYIAFGENRLWYGDKGQFPTVPLRLKLMQFADTGTIASQTVAISAPTAYPYLDTERLSVSSGTSQWPLTYLSPQQFAEHENSTGDPKFFTFLGGTIKTAPSGSLSFKHDYYYKFRALSTSNYSTLLLDAHPELYLLSACVEGALDMHNDALAGRFAARLQGRINALQTTDRNTAPGGSLCVQVGR